MRIAQYQTDYGYLSITDVNEKETNIPAGWVRVSEFLEVNFLPRKSDEITTDKVKQLDKVLDELMTQIERVRAQKQELLAISYEAEQA